MERRLATLASTEYDLVVIGGGIFGICAAWDAALRGLSVALLERGDFAQGASANCFKVVHGGIRYLQHGDLIRARESAAERRAFLRIAPHQVTPLPILVPTFGHGTRGKEFLAAGVFAYDLLTLDRNRGLSDPSRRIPSSRLASRSQVLEAHPGLDVPELTGGAIFYDAQMYSPARLAICFLLAAAEHGVEAANYVEATGFLTDRDGKQDRIRGVMARDTLSDQEFEVRGRIVLNATGGWVNELFGRAAGPSGLEPRPSFSRDAYFLVRRRMTSGEGLAVPGQTRDPDAILSRSARHLFLMPWRDSTLVGVWHVVWEDDPDRVRVTENDLAEFLAEVNASLPGLDLDRSEVALHQCGLVLFGENEPGAKNLRYGHRSELVDHARSEGVDGLVTLIGLRYTTARLEAARAVDLACRKLGHRSARPATATTPVYGGDFDSFEALAKSAARQHPGVPAESLQALLRNHGCEYGRVLGQAKTDSPELARLPGVATLEAELLQAVREEMAQKLADVVFRRTDIGTQGHPGDAALHAAADLMAAELGWEPARRLKELEDVALAFPSPSGETGASA